MKKYLVFSFNLGMPLLVGQNPTGCKCDDFDDLLDAQACAEIEKERWSRVSINEKTENGTRTRLAKYENGRRYPG